MPKFNSLGKNHSDLVDEINALRLQCDREITARKHAEEEIDAIAKQRDIFKTGLADKDKQFQKETLRGWELHQQCEAMALALEELNEHTATHLEDMEHYFEFKCCPTVDEVNACAVADSQVRLAIGCYKKFKEGG